MIKHGKTQPRHMPRPTEPDNDSVWYRGWECGWDDMASRYTNYCWVAYKSGADLDAPKLTAKTWAELLDEIDAEEE